jgi:hypothetical protein
MRGSAVHHTTGVEVPPTPFRRVRMDVEMWDAFGKAIEQAEPELDRSKVIREFVRWYIGETNSLPRRPRRADDGNDQDQR